MALPVMNRIKIYRCADCQVPQKAAGATKATSEAPSSMFRDWQRTQTQSSATDLTDPEAANGCPVLRDAGTIAERHTRAIEVLEPHTCVLSRARPGILCFSLDIRLTWIPDLGAHQRIVAFRAAGQTIKRTAELAGCSISQVKRVWAIHRTTATA